MFLPGFLLASTALNMVLGFLVQFKSYRKPLRLALLVLSILITSHLWVAFLAVSSASSDRWFELHRILLGIDLLIGLAVLELARLFLRGGEFDLSAWKWGRVRISIFTLAWVGTFLAEGILFASPEAHRYPGALDFRMGFRGPGLLLPTVLDLVAIYALYLIESTYRFAADYQRRIGRLCFIGLGVIAVFQIYFFSNILLYRILPEHFGEASSVVYGVVYPVVLAGFLRYRLGSEHISVPRDTVYTSATVFLTGAAFLGVAVTILIFQWLNLDFSYFERFLVGFSLCFLSVLVLGSGTMRRRISRYVNERFYSRKYDYQEQFFRLHKTAMSGADVDSALTELVENMKYSVTVSDAYFFILNWQDGNFYQHENKEEATRRGLAVSGDSPLARVLAAGGGPVDLLGQEEAEAPRRVGAREEPLIGELGIDAAFPIFMGDGQQGERLTGILALQGGRAEPFDAEDLDLIAVFTTSIGDVLFKNRVLKERIEQKQFESFHHVASFIIHDIKNQIATLSLIVKNAERNLGNPSFQTSMVHSVKSCSDSLQALIDRLAVAPKRQELRLTRHPLRPLLDEVVANSGVTALSGLEFTLVAEENSEAGVSAPVRDPADTTALQPPVAAASESPREIFAAMDRQSLFFVIRNLVNNSLESMRPGMDTMRSGLDDPSQDGPGRPNRLRLSFGSLGKHSPAKLRDLFGGGEQFFAGYGAFILVEDNGGGMDKEFVRRRLFQPFATTKEKGVGIGLYQCKTLVEKMGGRILVHSELGQGTEFCILLPAAASDSAA